MAASDSFASGNWLVREGLEDEFVSRWTDFLEWTRDNAEGFREASLLRSVQEPRRFVSFSEWDDDDAQAGWRSLPGFLDKLGACLDVCDDSETGRARRVVSV
jgi:heme-degrading monooxygenase HmoA